MRRFSLPVTGTVTFFLCVSMVSPAVCHSEELKDGIRRSYYRSGALLSEETIIHGKKEGAFTVYYESGAVKSKGTYRDGKDEGLFRKYYENGKKMFEVEYAMGKMDGPIRLYSRTGDLIREWEHSEKDDALDPETFEKIREEKSPVDEVIEENDDYQLVKEYYKNGKLKAEKFYRNNRLDGVSREYDENGELKVTEEYKDGVLISRKPYKI